MINIVKTGGSGHWREQSCVSSGGWCDEYDVSVVMDVVGLQNSATARSVVNGVHSKGKRLMSVGGWYNKHFLRTDTCRRPAVITPVSHYGHQCPGLRAQH